MQFEEKKASALNAVRSRIDQFHAALIVTEEQVRGLLSGSSKTEDDRSEALGYFAKGKVNMERFNTFAPKVRRLENDAEAPVRAAQAVLKSLLAEGDDLFIVDMQDGKGLGHSLSVKLAHIGRAFAAARVVDLAKNGAYKEDKHAATPDIALLGFYRVASSFIAEMEILQCHFKEKLLVVDFNPEVFRELKRQGIRVVYGDISNEQTLHHAGIEEAKVVVSTISDDILVGTSNMNLIRQIRHLAPQARIVVTAVNRSQALKLYEAGADYVLRPNYLTGRHLLEVLERLLREAHSERLRLAVASTTTPENVTVLLSETVGAEGLTWFDVIAAGDMVERKKPAPDVYLLALERLGLDAADCLVLEDTEAGLASARAAGLATVITVNGATRHQDFTGALLVVDQLGEPGHPMEVLAGDAGGAGLVNVELLRQLHAAT